MRDNKAFQLQTSAADKFFPLHATKHTITKIMKKCKTCILVIFRFLQLDKITKHKHVYLTSILADLFFLLSPR
jgi:hypothetical protein